MPRRVRTREKLSTVMISTMTWQVRAARGSSQQWVRGLGEAAPGAQECGSVGVCESQTESLNSLMKVSCNVQSGDVYFSCTKSDTKNSYIDSIFK